MSETYLQPIACIGFSDETIGTVEHTLGGDFSLYFFSSVNELYRASILNKTKFKAIISEMELSHPKIYKLKESLTKAGLSEIPFSIIIDELQKVSVRQLVNQGVSEVFVKPLSPSNFGKKLHYIIEKNDKGAPSNVRMDHKYRMPISKRIFDIICASIAIVLLSPLFLIVSLLIAIESKGPIFYYSLRVGTGYQIFKFYKFRSMFVGADSKLNQLHHLNQYAKLVSKPSSEMTEDVCTSCKAAGTGCQSALFADNKMWCEKTYQQEQASNGAQTFIKIKDDPRVSVIGKFIRNTSIDELPQLWNVLKGDMSIVGNRPLPLYEAEKLTTDKYALRFMAPAGITGLWQVSKRGKGEMSEDERISLDNDYAKNFGLLFDLRLIVKTVPALFQKENV